MKPDKRLISFSPSRQSGAALVVGLVVLVLLTLLGIAAMRTSALEERMAGNLRESNIAFQSAEGALREAIASDLPAKPYDGTKTGFTQVINKFQDASSKPISEFSYWTGYDWITKAEGATQGLGINQQPRYVVETMRANVTLHEGGAQAIRLYRVTAVSRGATDRSEVIVQGAIIRED